MPNTDSPITCKHCGAASEDTVCDTCWAIPSKQWDAMTCQCGHTRKQHVNVPQFGCLAGMTSVILCNGLCPCESFDLNPLAPTR